MLPGQVGHGGIQVHQHHLLHAGVLEDLPHGESVAAAADQHAPGLGPHGEGRMDQGLVVAVLVRGGELQVAVQEELEAAPAPGHDDALVGGVLGVDDLVREDLLLHGQGEPVGAGHARAQEDQHHRAAQPQAEGGAQQGLQQEGGPEAHAGVEEAEDQAGAHQTQLGHEQQGEEQGGRQGADVVQGQHLRHQVLEAHLVAQDAHEQRDLQAHQGADGDDGEVERGLEGVGAGEGLEEEGRREAAHQGHGQLQVHEALGEAPVDVLGEVRAQAHGAQVDPDDRGELHDGVPQQVAGQRARHQLVDQPAGCDDEDADEEEGGLQRLGGTSARSSMDGRGDDQGDAQDQAAQDDAQGDVLVHLHLLAQGEGQHLHQERSRRGRGGRGPGCRRRKP